MTEFSDIKVSLVDHMGDDLTVVNSARVSFDKHKENFDDKDEGLIRYLARHGHWTPFSHPQITLREDVPIFVARQRFKHMVGFTYNEVSRRYVDDEPSFYNPDEWRERPDGSVKQGSGAGVVVKMKDSTFSGDVDVDFGYSQVVGRCKSIYNSMLEAGVSPEQARMVLPQSMMTSYYVTGSLAAFARAYIQRVDSHAQKEIRFVAEKWGEIIEPLFPVSWKELTRDA